MYLTAAGYRVEHAEDGVEALAKFRANRPDLVLLDLMLPGMDGSKVCDIIRAESRVPVIMLTARDTDRTVAMLESGADDYVTKPFSPPELVARVRAVASPHRRSRRSRRRCRPGPSAALPSIPLVTK